MHEFFEIVIAAVQAMQAIEIAAVFFSIVYVILAAREHIWCWPAAMVSVILYTIICIQANLWAETGLQIFYAVMAIVGYQQWSKKRNTAVNDEGKAPIKSHALKHHLLPISISLLLTLIVGFILKSYTTAANPFLDSFTTVFSLYATWLVTRKVLENWLYWIMIDTASIVLYGSRGLYLSALLFFSYTIIAVVGYVQWRKNYLQQQAWQAA